MAKLDSSIAEVRSETRRQLAETAPSSSHDMAMALTKILARHGADSQFPSSEATTERQRIVQDILERIEANQRSPLRKDLAPIPIRQSTSWETTPAPLLPRWQSLRMTGKSMAVSYAPSMSDILSGIQQGVKILGTVTSVSFVMRNRRRSACLPSCTCNCHSRTAQELRLQSGLFGALFIGYSGQPAAGQHCTSASCIEKVISSLEVTYIFPTWFLTYGASVAFSRTLHGPRLHVVLRKRVGFTPGNILNAVKGDDVAGIKLHLDVDPDAINCILSCSGWSLLHLAVDLGLSKAMRFLLQRGCDLDRVDDFGRSAGAAFVYNVLSGRYKPEVLHQFDELIPMSKYVDDFELTFLSKVVLGICHGDLSEILASSAGMLDLDRPDAAFGMTPMHWAVMRQDVTIVRQLLDAGARLDLENTVGVRALFYSVGADQSEAGIQCFDALIEAGADPSHPDKFGWTIFHRACRFNCLITVKSMIAGGVDPNMHASKGGINNGPAVFIAAWWGAADVLRYLVECGADINAADRYGTTAFTAAIETNRHACLRLLLDRGADYILPDASDEYRIPHLIALVADAETLEILTEHGMQGLDFRERNKAGFTAVELFQKRRGVSEGVIEAFGKLLESVESGGGRETAFKKAEAVHVEEVFFDAVETLAG
jgi:ankyrin repeat protein